ncbi:tail fiber protein [Escherichia coli]|nr:tail fiber protein [Escherichia coli]
MGEGSALPVGVPVPWPLETPPTGWLKCNGAAFSSEMYPKLAKAYPTNKLPDLRGEFIRGWDDGRGVDAGRALLSIQTGMLEKHRHIVVANDGYDTKDEWEWICPYISRHLLSLNPLLACCRRYSRGER